jgi:hypothetical protein
VLQRTERLTHLSEVKADRPIYCCTAPLFCTSDAMPSAGERVRGWRLETKVCVLDFSDKPADRLLDLIYDAATDAEVFTRRRHRPRALKCTWWTPSNPPNSHRTASGVA